MKLYRAVRSNKKYDEPVEAVIAADSASAALEALLAHDDNRGAPAASWSVEPIRLGTRAKVLLVQTVDG
jgi:hypothetical protein